MREARNRFANLVKEAFAKAGREPIDFASEFKTAERREGFYALLAGDETPFCSPYRQGYRLEHEQLF